MLTLNISRFFGGGPMEEEEEKVVKGDDVIVELDATLEDLYMGGTLKVLNLMHNCTQTKKTYMQIESLGI